MSSNHHHSHDNSHDHHEKPKRDYSALWKTMVTKGIWVVYPIMGVCLLHIFWLMNDRLDSIMYNTVPINEKPAPFVDIKLATPGSVQKGMDIKLIKTPSDEMIKLGKATFQEQCALCHGAEGKGDGPAGGGTARNFHAKEGWKNGRELSMMFGTITSGIPGTSMASFDRLPVETRISLIHYIRKFANDFPEVKDVEVESLDKQFNLSKETVNPHRIPIKIATQLLIEEAVVNDNKKVHLIHTIKTDKSKGSEIIRNNSENLDKTVASLQSNLIWKKDFDSFIKFISVNIEVNGLKADLLLLEKSQLEEVFNFLKGLK